MTSCHHEPNFISELDTVCYDSVIAPILQTSCGLSGCHNSATKSEGFDASSYQSILSFVKPGDAKASPLYQAITQVYLNGLMPPDKPLTQAERNLILVWIEQGAKKTSCHELPPPAPDSICFVQDVQPLILSSCGITGCHDEITAEKGYIFTSYAHIMANDDAVVPFDPSNSEMYKVLNESGDDRMPPAPMAEFTFEEKEIIRKWIAEGALNSNCPTTTCDTINAISYSETVWPAINRSCVGCHNSSQSSGGVDLSNYNQIFFYANTLRNGVPILLGVIRKESGFVGMPPSGSLDNCSIRQIELWIEQGSLNN